MSRTARAIAVSAALMFSLHMVSLHAQRKTTKPAPAPHAAKTTTAKPQAPKTTMTKPATGKPTLTKQQAPKAATAKASKGTSAKPTTKLAKQTTEKTKPVTKSASAKTEKKDATTKQAGAQKTTADTTTATSETTTATPPLENLSPVQQKLAKNTKLASKLEARLPAGTNLMEAAEGFRNLGQFVAAVNVSNNLNIPFDKLKTDMVDKKKSLGQSIQDLRPSTSSPTVEAQHAEYEAGTLIAQTEQETSLTASASVTTKPSKTSTTATAKPRKGNRKNLTGGE